MQANFLVRSAACLLEKRKKKTGNHSRPICELRKNYCRHQMSYVSAVGAFANRLHILYTSVWARREHIHCNNHTCKLYMMKDANAGSDYKNHYIPAIESLQSRVSRGIYIGSSQFIMRHLWYVQICIFFFSILSLFHCAVSSVLEANETSAPLSDYVIKPSER